MHKKLISTKLLESSGVFFLLVEWKTCIRNYYIVKYFCRFFLQHPANPDLLYIIFFCHSQLTITILLCLIFASKVGVTSQQFPRKNRLLRKSDSNINFINICIENDYLINLRNLQFSSLNLSLIKTSAPDINGICLLYRILD